MLHRLEALDTCAVSDALDFLGLAGATTGIRPLWACRKIVGRAMTVRVGPKTEDAPTHHLATPAIEESDPDTVLVIANDGSHDVSCWGDVLAHAAVAKGARGVVIDGACRDIDANQTLGFPVFGRGVVPVSARDRIVQRDHGGTIEFGGVAVTKGDYVIADGSGTVVIRQDHAERVIDLAERLAKREAAMIAAIQTGASVVDVMHDKEFDRVLEGAR